MQITGHKTRNVFEAYNIVSLEDMKRALKKQEQGLAKQSDKKPPIDDRRKFYQKEGVTQIYTDFRTLIPVEGDVDEQKQRPLKEIIDEIVEDPKGRKVSQADSEGKWKTKRDSDPYSDD